MVFEKYYLVTKNFLFGHGALFPVLCSKLCFYKQNPQKYTFQDHCFMLMKMIKRYIHSIPFKDFCPVHLVFPHYLFDSSLELLLWEALDYNLKGEYQTEVEPYPQHNGEWNQACQWSHSSIPSVRCIVPSRQSPFATPVN